MDMLEQSIAAKKLVPFDAPKLGTPIHLGFRAAMEYARNNKNKNRFIRMDFTEETIKEITPFQFQTSLNSYQVKVFHVGSDGKRNYDMECQVSGTLGNAFELAVMLATNLYYSSLKSKDSVSGFIEISSPKGEVYNTMKIQKKERELSGVPKRTKNQIDIDRIRNVLKEMGFNF